MGYQNLHVLEHLARHFGSPNQSYQALTVTQMSKIYLFWRISASPTKMYILENLNQISGKLEIHTKTQKFTYFGENIYFLQEKKILVCASFPKNIRIRDKIGNLIMKATFI